MVSENKMLRHIFVCLLAVIIVVISTEPASARWDDPAYHHLDEILPELVTLRDSLQGEGLNRIRIDTIGYSQQDHLPILAVFVSDDVDVIFPERRDRPAVVFNGSVHAEEILGVEYVMWFIRELATKGSKYRVWRQSVDTYLIPTVNVEGLTMVYTLDNTWRKNKRDNVGDGMLRWQPGWGGDSTGVDPNRNFPLFWVHGGTLFLTGDQEKYDYYRGPAPASEAETRTLIEFMDKIRPLYSLTIHSSRTGNVAEQVIYPFGYGKGSEMKKPPDSDFLDEFAREVAQRCQRLGSANSYYSVVRIANPRGDAETFYYVQYGTNAIRVEIGQKDEGMQPVDTVMYQIINDVTLGFELMLNSAADARSDEKGSIITSRIDIRVTDINTGEPLYARLKLDKRSDRLIPYRYTNPRTGMYYWAVPSYSDTLRVSKFGYEPWIRQVFVGDGPTSPGGRARGVQMTPLDWHDVVFRIQENGVVISDMMELTIEHLDTTFTSNVYDGEITINLPEGNYAATVYNGEKHVPRTVNFTVNDADSTWFLDIGLSMAVPLLTQNFDGHDVIYSSDNVLNRAKTDSLTRWELTRDLYHSAPRCLTDSRMGNTSIYEDGWAAPYNMLSQSFDLSNSGTAALVYWINQALEPGHDSVWVEVSTGGTPGTDPDSWEWMQVNPAHQELAMLNWQDRDAMMEIENRPWNANDINYMKYNDWERFIIPLDDFLGEAVVHFRFHMSTDYFIQEDGIYIDDVALLASGDVPPQVSSVPTLPEKFSVGQPYPNPFNGRLNVRINLAEAADLKVSLYDLNGRTAMIVPGESYTAGSHNFSLNADALASGLYFMRIQAENNMAYRKIMLIK